MFKRFITTLLIPIMAISIILVSKSISVNATEIPTVVAECPVNGIHYMNSSGPALCYDINDHSTLLYSGGAYKCKYCGDLFFCQGYPHEGGAICHYYDGIQDYTLYGGVYTMFLNPNGILYTSNSTLPGFQFYPAY